MNTKNYKNFIKQGIGVSDVAALTMVGCDDKGLISAILKFGEDGRYTAYIVKQSKNEEVVIGNHYTKVATFKGWIKIYDDEELTFKADADEINVYRAGERGCIIQLIH